MNILYPTEEQLVELLKVGRARCGECEQLIDVIDNGNVDCPNGHLQKEVEEGWPQHILYVLNEGGSYLIIPDLSRNYRSREKNNKNYIHNCVVYEKYGNKTSIR